MERKLVPMPGAEKLENLKRCQLIAELEELHRKQRSWQRAVNDEVLDYEAISKISTEELEEIVKGLRGVKHE